MMAEVSAFLWIMKKNWFPSNYKVSMIICHPSKDFSKEWNGGNDICFPVDGQKSWVDA
jgi:hypothetical protein